MRPTAALTLAMQQRGLNQKQVAELLGISEQYLSDILHSRRNISANVAVRLEAHFGIDGRKAMLDQALTEYERAKMEYAKEVAG